MISSKALQEATNILMLWSTSRQTKAMVFKKEIETTTLSLIPFPIIFSNRNRINIL